jgi:large subunit ribosomal protein L29
MKASQVREMDTTTINEEISELKRELFDLRFQQATGQLENTARIRKVRKAIARMKTVLNERR